jgi:hypothetical protein
MAASKFTVVIDAPLTAAQTAAINKAIQSAVLQQVARTDNGILGRKIIGTQTDGIYIRNFKTLEALKINPGFKKLILPK